MDAVSDSEQGEKSCYVIYRSHNMASSLRESQNRSGVSSWPTGGWSLTDWGERHMSWRRAWFEPLFWGVCRICSILTSVRRTGHYWCYNLETGIDATNGHWSPKIFEIELIKCKFRSKFRIQIFIQMVFKARKPSSSSSLSCQPPSGCVRAWFPTDATCTLCSGIQEGAGHDGIYQSPPNTTWPTASSPANLPTMPWSRWVSERCCRAVCEGDRSRRGVWFWRRRHSVKG